MRSFYKSFLLSAAFLSLTAPVQPADNTMARDIAALGGLSFIISAGIVYFLDKKNPESAQVTPPITPPSKRERISTFCKQTAVLGIFIFACILNNEWKKASELSKRCCLHCCHQHSPGLFDSYFLGKTAS